MGEGKVVVKIMRNSLEQLIGDLLRQKGWTLSIAESCTGGLISDRITNVSRSSDYFMGGMVNYSNESKKKHLGVPMEEIKRHGAVSSQVAEKMARGVRKTFHTTSDYPQRGWPVQQAAISESVLRLEWKGLSPCCRIRVQTEQLPDSFNSSMQIANFKLQISNCRLQIEKVEVSNLEITLMNSI
jgi:hypothetical protein